jgi:hypothetical protein
MGLLTEIVTYYLKSSAANNNGYHNNRSLLRNVNLSSIATPTAQGASQSWAVDIGRSGSSHFVAELAASKRTPATGCPADVSPS